MHTPNDYRVSPFPDSLFSILSMNLSIPILSFVGLK